MLTGMVALARDASEVLSAGQNFKRGRRGRSCEKPLCLPPRRRDAESKPFIFISLRLRVAAVRRFRAVFPPLLQRWAYSPTQPDENRPRLFAALRVPRRTPSPCPRPMAAAWPNPQGHLASSTACSPAGSSKLARPCCTRTFPAGLPSIPRFNSPPSNSRVTATTGRWAFKLKVSRDGEIW